MAAAFFQVRVGGRTAQRLEAMRNALGRRPDRLTKAIRETILARVRAQFDTKRDANGKRWKTWAPTTKYVRQQESKAARPFKRGPISLLEHTGAMRRSLFARTVRGQVRIGFGVSYAGFHETGTRKMPARPLLTEDLGQSLAKSHRISIGLAVGRAINKTLEALT